MDIEYITICKYSTFFSIFRDKEDHRFDYFRNIDRQEDITDFIQIKLINESTYDRSYFSIYDEIINHIRNYGIAEKVLFDTGNKIEIYDTKSGFEKIFRIISNSRFKYGLKVDIVHHMFSKLSARVTNCNTREEKFVNYYKCVSPRISNKTRRKRSIKITGEQAVNLARFITMHKDIMNNPTNYKYGEYTILFGLEPRDYNSTDRYLSILRRLGIDPQIAYGQVRYDSIKPNIELYRDGYPFIRKQVDNSGMTRQMLLEYYELKKVNRKVDYEKVEKILGMRKDKP